MQTDICPITDNVITVAFFIIGNFDTYDFLSLISLSNDFGTFHELKIHTTA